MSALGPRTAPLSDDFSKPGFYLLDNAGGRFSVDREFGVVTMADDAYVITERNAVHAVRLRVVEASGASYDLDMQLRITGHVPQMVGAEDFSFEPLGAAIPDVKPATRIALAAAPRAIVAWASFTAVAASAPTSLGDEPAPFGALIAAPLPQTKTSSADLALAETLPAPAPAAATWTI